MPLTRFQEQVFAVLVDGRGRDSYLAGDSALHLGAGGERYSADLDFFHTTARAANDAFHRDATSLRHMGWTVVVDAQFPGFVKARVSDARDTMEIDWAHESAWRFLPLVALDGGGVMPHPIDLAINKLVALAHRREPRDLVDAIFADRHILPFPALVWAVVEKNPGLNPAAYLEQFRRRTITPEDAAFLRFVGTYDVADAAQHFRKMVFDTDQFIADNLQREPGALFCDTRSGAFFLPKTTADWDHAREHRGALGGVVPQLADVTLSSWSGPVDS